MVKVATGALFKGFVTQVYKCNQVTTNESTEERTDEGGGGDKEAVVAVVVSRCA